MIPLADREQMFERADFVIRRRVPCVQTQVARDLVRMLNAYARLVERNRKLEMESERKPSA